MLHSLIPALARIFGCVPMTKHYNVSYNTTGIGSGLILCTLRASTARPLLVEIGVEIVTVFNAATTNNFSIGTSTTATELLAASLITAGTIGQYPLQLTATVQPGKKRITANTPIYVKSAGVNAVGTLTSDATAPSDGDTVTIGSRVYTFKTALTGAADEVLIGVSAAVALDNIKSAINATTGAGTTYGTGTTINTQVTATTNTNTTQVVEAIVGGTVGNAIATTEASSHLAWGGVVLAGGTTATTGNANVMITVTPLFQGT